MSDTLSGKPNPNKLFFDFLNGVKHNLSRTSVISPEFKTDIIEWIREGFLLGKTIKEEEMKAEEKKS